MEGRRRRGGEGVTVLTPGREIAALREGRSSSRGTGGGRGVAGVVLERRSMLGSAVWAWSGGVVLPCLLSAMLGYL